MGVSAMQLVWSNRLGAPPCRASQVGLEISVTVTSLSKLPPDCLWTPHSICATSGMIVRCWCNQIYVPPALDSLALLDEV
jgi:hypothetical protein